jgi:hypothetical protein
MHNPKIKILEFDENNISTLNMMAFVSVAQDDVTAETRCG